MKGVTRLMRLPVGSNGKTKYDPGGVACKLLEWAPERRFKIEDLATSTSSSRRRPGAAARRSSLVRVI